MKKTRSSATKAAHQLMVSPTGEQIVKAFYGLLEASLSEKSEIREVIDKVVDGKIHPVLAYGDLLRRFPELFK